MSETQAADNSSKPEQETKKKPVDAKNKLVEPKTMDSLTITGECILTMGMSTLYADILGQELVDQINSPDVVSMVQYYLKDRRPEDMEPGMFASVLQQIPEGILDTVRESIFASGALNRRMDCQVTLKSGQPFQFASPKTMVQLDVLDGRLAQINPPRS